MNHDPISSGINLAGSKLMTLLCYKYPVKAQGTFSDNIKKNVIIRVHTKYIKSSD